MKLTLSWLKDHLATDADAKTIAEKLTSIGLEVESLEDKAASLASFSVARVVTAEQHPNADKLRLLTVDTGREVAQVVCGAPNAHAGLVGVFAPPGTFIPGSNFTLSIAKIRGVESRGMMCSERELQLSEEHDGIIELPADTAIGSPAAAALGLGDPVIDVALTPNRGDAASVYGIARDLAAAGIGTLKGGAVTPVKGAYPSPITVSLDFPESAASACTMFAGRLIRGVKNRPSPKWVQDRLKAVGVRPISALVDVTNLVAHDRGRPLHVFDAAKLKGNMRARLAKPGETMLALDGKTYTLDSEMTVIADDVAARGIAGVMGGEDSSCTDATTDVFVESAMFDPVRTARTGRTLGIISDARYRFERGVDPEFVVPGLELATKLILEFCGGEASEIVVAGKATDWKRTISMAPNALRRLAGIDLPRSDIVRILTKSRVRGHWQRPPRSCAAVLAPGHPWLGRSRRGSRAHPRARQGAVRGDDAAIGGRASDPDARAAPHRHDPPRARLARLQRGGAFLLHLRGTRPQLFGGGDDARQLENPISADLDAMRPSLLPALLASAARNQARGTGHAMMFEIGPAILKRRARRASRCRRRHPRRRTAASLDKVGDPSRLDRGQGGCHRGARSRLGRGRRAHTDERAVLVSPRPLGHDRARTEAPSPFRRVASARDRKPSISKDRSPVSRSSSTPSPKRKRAAAKPGQSSTFPT